MIHFSNPEAFWLVPVSLVAAWAFPRLGLTRPLRILVLLLILGAWLNPHFQRMQPGVDLWVLLDQSDSVQQFATASFRETERILAENRGPHDTVNFVDMAGEARVRDPAALELTPGSTNATRLSHALHYTLSMRRPNRASRLLYIGDGFSTEPLNRVSERLLASGLPLDVRLSVPEIGRDVRLEDLTAPARVRPREPFLIDAWISGPQGTDVEVILYRDDQEMDRRTVSLRGERERIRWASELRQPGASLYNVVVQSEDDPVPGTNRRQAWVEAQGGNRVLLLTSYVNDPVAALLRKDGLQVDVVTELGTLTVGSLSGTGAVWIHNVHASRIPREVQEALDFFVREQGGGMVMVGGASSFGAGGYHESPLDPLLPVSMELKKEDRKISIALAVVLDRSGSMSAAAGGGFTKMDLANAGAARAIELLGESDTVTVFAVDTKAHQIVPLTRAGGQRDNLTSMVRRIQSTGGGIYVFNGLKAAWDQVKDAPQSQRHVILFADAADAEQSEGVGNLLREMGEGNTTVSVIALGSAMDPDAPFLEQIAVDGKGRLFFNADPSTLPAVFAQETVSVSRSAFLDEPVSTEATPGWRELAPVTPDWPEVLDGYNLNYLREEASESLRSADEYAAPLVAHWERGGGRVAALSMPLGGPYSERMRNWNEVGDMVRTLNRWVMRNEWPPGVHLGTQRLGDTLRVTLQANREWQDRFISEPPVLVTSRAGEQDTVIHPWRRIAPGKLETDLPLDAWVRIRGAVRSGNRSLPFGPVSGQPGSEWEFDRQRLEELRTLSSASGGSSLTSLTDAFVRPPQQAVVGTRSWWLWVSFAAFLFEAFQSRIAGQRIGFERGQAKARVKKAEESRVEKEAPSEPEFGPAPRSAFRKAKR